MAAIGAAGVLVLALGGCGGHQDGKDAKPTPHATNAKDPQAAQRRAVLKAYRKMTAAEYHSYATGKLDPKVRTYAADKALAGIKETLFAQSQDHTLMKGKVKRSPKVTALSADADPPQATVTDCADSSHLNAVHKSSGKKVPYSGSRRHVVTATGQRNDGQWQFVRYTIDRERKC